MSYNSNGQIKITTVTGSSYTGLYAADGSWNVVINDGSTYTGIFHPCGALNAVVTTDPTASYYASNGSVNLVQNISGGYSPVSPTGSSSLVLPTNLVSHSDTFNLWSISALTVTTNVAKDPVFQTTTADRITETATTAAHSLTGNTINYTVGNNYTFSVYAKYENSQYIQLLFGSGAFGSNAYGNFDIQNGALATMGSSATGLITNAGNGWYRISITSPATATAASGSAIFAANAGTMTRAFGYAGTATNTRLIANSQIELGSTPGIYVPTA